MYRVDENDLLTMQKKSMYLIVLYKYKFIKMSNAILYLLQLNKFSSTPHSIKRAV